MPRNDTRREQLADAGLSVLAAEGARGLTHRAVDRRAEVPLGTTANYFRRRAELLAGLVERIGQRLAPSPEVHGALTARTPTREVFSAYLRDIVRRLTDDPEVTIALFELRLEAARRPEAGELMADWMRRGFAADVAFHEGEGLPGGAFDVALFHYAVDGLMLDRLTQPIDPGTPTDEILEALSQRLLSD